MKCIYSLFAFAAALFAIPQPQPGFGSMIEQAELAARRGDVAGAEAILKDACADLTPVPSLARDGTCRRARAVVAYVRGDFRRAHEMFLDAVDRYERIGEDALAPLAGTLLQVGEVCVRLALWQDADDALNRSLDLHRTMYGAASSRAADVMASLGGLWVAQGFHAKAEPLLLEALGIYKRTQSVGNPAYAALLSHLAILYSSTGRAQEAVPMVREASAIIDRSLGSDHINAASSLANLASAYLLARDPARALPLLKKARAAYETALGPDHADIASILMQEALIDLAGKRTALAANAATRAIPIFERAYGPRHLETLIARANYALILLSDGRTEAAERLTLEVLDQIEGDLPRAVRTRASCQYALGDIYAQQRRWSEAVQRYAAALALYETIDPRDTPELPVLLEDYARVLRRDRAGRQQAHTLEQRAKALRAR